RDGAVVGGAACLAGRTDGRRHQLACPGLRARCDRVLEIEDESRHIEDAYLGELALVRAREVQHRGEGRTAHVLTSPSEIVSGAGPPSCADNRVAVATRCGANARIRFLVQRSAGPAAVSAPATPAGPSTGAETAPTPGVRSPT